MCGARVTAPVALHGPASGEDLASRMRDVPRPLWQRMLIAAGILIGVQWALVALLFAMCAFS
jgi:hypothetical protein